MFKPFNGPNGWYVARESEGGSHQQPPNHSARARLTEEEARAEADRRNAGEPPTDYAWEDEGVVA